MVQVETALYSSPLVSSAACVAVPDEHWGECVCAVIELHPPQDYILSTDTDGTDDAKDYCHGRDSKALAAELCAHARTLLAPYKVRAPLLRLSLTFGWHSNHLTAKHRSAYTFQQHIGNIHTVDDSCSCRDLRFCAIVMTIIQFVVRCHAHRSPVWCCSGLYRGHLQGKCRRMSCVQL